jgi:hypothetical protein
MKHITIKRGSTMYMSDINHTQLALDSAVFDLLLDLVLDELEVEDSDGSLTYYDADKSLLRNTKGIFLVEYRHGLLIVVKPDGDRVILEPALGSDYRLNWLFDNIDLLNSACKHTDFRVIRAQAMADVLSTSDRKNVSERVERLVISALQDVVLALK